MEHRIVCGHRIFGARSCDELARFALKRKRIMFALNVTKLAVNNEKIREATHHQIGYADGVIAQVALIRRGLRYSKRVPGAELWLKIAELAEAETRIFLMGAAPSTVRAVGRKFRLQFPHLRIVGEMDGYYSESDVDRRLKIVQDAAPDILFCAMGSPRQEVFMMRLAESYQCLCVGLGGSFDIYAGNIQRASPIFRRIGLEWLYRVLKEPRRLWPLLKASFSIPKLLALKN